MGCLVFDGASSCVWCRGGPETHVLFPCKSCGGDSFLPDPLDRASRRAGLPVWAWRHVLCECTQDEHGRVRQGGWLLANGEPASDEQLVACGITLAADKVSARLDKRRLP